MDGQKDSLDDLRCERLKLAIEAEKVQKSMLKSVESGLKQLVSYLPEDNPLEYTEQKWERMKWLLARLEAHMAKAANFFPKYVEPQPRVSGRTGRPSRKDPAAPPDPDLPDEPVKPRRPSFGEGTVGGQ